VNRESLPGKVRKRKTTSLATDLRRKRQGRIFETDEREKKGVERLVEKREVVLIRNTRVSRPIWIISSPFKCA